MNGEQLHWRPKVESHGKEDFDSMEDFDGERDFYKNILCDQATHSSEVAFWEAENGL